MSDSCCAGGTGRLGSSTRVPVLICLGVLFNSSLQDWRGKRPHNERCFPRSRDTVVRGKVQFSSLFIFNFIFFKDLIYWRERACMRGERSEGGAGSALRREPDAGLRPRTPGSWPEVQADAEPTEPPGALTLLIFRSKMSRQRALSLEPGCGFDTRTLSEQSCFWSFSGFSVGLWRDIVWQVAANWTMS